MNVLMFGFDSMSRMTWIRNLPKTYEYFTKHLGGTVLEGYNIVGTRFFIFETLPEQKIFKGWKRITIVQ